MTTQQRIERKTNKLALVLSKKFGFDPVEAVPEIAAALTAFAEETEASFIKAIKDEPEYPGDIPDEMWDAIKNDRDATAEAMRLTVKLTKQGIKDRIAPSTGEKPER